MLLGLDALPLDEARKGPAVDPQHAPDADGVEATFVDQAPDRLGVDTELICDLTHAVELRRVDLEHALTVTQVCGACMGRMAHAHLRLGPCAARSHS